MKCFNLILILFSSLAFGAGYPVGSGSGGGGMSNPMTTGGDIIFGGAGGLPTRLTNGTAAQCLKSQGTTVAPQWGSCGSGFTYTANQYGVALSDATNADMVILAPASTGRVLYSGGTGANPSWQYNPQLGGASAGAEGQLGLLDTSNNGVEINVMLGTGNWNFNLPTAGGSSGDLLTSQGGTSTAMSWTTLVPVDHGGTGSGGQTAHGVALWEGAGVNMGGVAPGGTGELFVGAGGADPSWTWTPTLGVAASINGTLGLANGNMSGNVVTLKNPSALAAYNFNFPATAGTSGQIFTSGAGGTTANQWVTVLPVANGGTNATAFTQGSLVFAGAGGTYTQDNTGIYYDATSHKMGLGVTGTPGAQLEISSANLAGIKVTNTNNASAAQVQLFDNGVETILSAAAGVEGSEGTQSNHPFHIISNGANRITVSAAGAIAFDTGYGAGTITSDSSGNLTSVSDETLKSVLRPFTKGLKALADIKPITYKWNKKSGLEMHDEYSGFSAQNVQKTIPEAVSKNNLGQLGLQDRPILAALVNAVNELSARLDKLEGKPPVVTPKKKAK